jgi:hypothetical protein
MDTDILVKFRLLKAAIIVLQMERFMNNVAEITTDVMTNIYQAS